MSNLNIGKWKYDKDEGDWLVMDDRFSIIAIVQEESDIDPEKAARLIASAPELLVVVQKLASFYGKLWDSADVKGAGFLTPESVVQYDELHAEAANAIAKATGESA